MFIDSESRHPLGFRIDDVMDAMADAGAKIMDFYRSGQFTTQTKGDSTPLTQADVAADQVISETLRRLTPDIPVVSEESPDPEKIYTSRGRYAWLVDPLDGTKEFINKTGEFTVNVALLDEAKPICGFVYVPATQDRYYGLGSGMAFKRDQKGRQVPCQVRTADPDQLICLMSRRHGPKLHKQSQHNPGLEVRLMGSSLKGCMIAEGLADIHVRIGPTSRWDTAAMQAVVESAGGRVLTLDGEPLAYDRSAILNPNFVVLGAGSIPVEDIVAACY